MNKLKTVWISDTHIGKYFTRTDYLLEFLKQLQKQQPEKIYIVGDFIDGWKLKRSWHWSEECNLIIRKLLTLEKNGVQIFYIAGNHDEFLRTFIHGWGHGHNLVFNGITFCDEVIHHCVNGKKLLVTHGDGFDTVIRYAMKYASWVCYLGDKGYDYLICLNMIVNWFRKKMGFEYWSMSHFIKKKVKKATNYIGCFEEVLAKYAKEKECDGVVCGHIHSAEINQIEDIDYYNCGDWVESCTALMEYEDGSIKLYTHPQNH